MGGQLWQYIIFLIVLVYQVKGRDGPIDIYMPPDVDRSDGDSNVNINLDARKSARSGIYGRSLPRPLFCYDSPDGGDCLLKVLPRYYYDYQNNKCSLFFWSGCGGNANRFLSESDCVKACSPSNIL